MELIVAVLMLHQLESDGVRDAFPGHSNAMIRAPAIDCSRNQVTFGAQEASFLTRFGREGNPAYRKRAEPAAVLTDPPPRSDVARETARNRRRDAAIMDCALAFAQGRSSVCLSIMKLHRSDLRHLDCCGKWVTKEESGMYQAPAICLPRDFPALPLPGVPPAPCRVRVPSPFIGLHPSEDHLHPR